MNAVVDHSVVLKDVRGALSVEEVTSSLVRKAQVRVRASTFLALGSHMLAKRCSDGAACPML